MNSKIGESLRLIRVFHDKKQIELADDLRISQSFLSEIEKGHKEPSLELLERYARVFETSPSAILFFHEDQPKNRKRASLKSKVRGRMISFLQRVADAGEAS